MTVPAELEAELAPDFQVIRLLGKGSMGTVYLARENALERLVAVKVPLPELARDEEVRKRFAREAKAVARIRHPSAAQVYRSSQLSDGTPYLIMQYLEGRTMEDVLAAQGPFQVSTALSILEKVAGALAEAHSKQIIHRDLRPGNVMWNEATGEAVLTDFGIAGILETGSEASTRITRAGQRLGEVGFVSPEQLRGETLTEAADIYSLGVLAHHLLAGEGPFMGKSPAALIKAHLQDAPRSLAERVPGVPAAVADLVDRCLNKSAAQRPSAERIRSTLEKIRTGEAVATASGSASGHDSPLPGPIRDFIAQVRQRKVGGTAIGYLFVGFVILQVTEVVVIPGVDQDTALRVMTGLLVAGFPLALVGSWLYDVSSKGIVRTKGSGEGGSRGADRAVQIVAIVVSILLAGALGWWFLPS